MTAAAHRRTATGRPPAEHVALHECDGLPPPAHSNAQQPDERRGAEVEVDVEDLAPSGADPASPWCPRPASPRELDDARTVLVVHRLDQRTGRCAACAADCPCAPALDAGRVLAEAGAWNTVPFPDPGGWQADPEPSGRNPARAGGRWPARLVRRLRSTVVAR